MIHEALSGYIDTHVHIGDMNHHDGGLSRMWSMDELNDFGVPVVAKAHFLPFVPEAKYVFGSMTLNDCLDPKKIHRVAKEMSKPFVVWFPSLNAQAHHNAVSGDTAWTNLFKGVELGPPISVLRDGSLSNEAMETVAAISETNAILATGHLSPQEVNFLVPYAIEAGVRSVVLTHVSSRHNRLTIADQKSLISMGRKGGVPVFAEHCAITWIDGKPGAYDVARDFIAPIKEVGPEHCIISSDCGRVVEENSSKPRTPIECLDLFITQLIEQGIDADSIQKMIAVNPRILLGISDS